MSFPPGDFLRVANNLCGSRSTEGDWRTAAGRAYYANFLTVRDALKVVAINESEHKAAERALRNRDHLLAQTLGKRRRYRIACDYDMIVSITKNEVVLHVKLAERLLNDLRQGGLV